MALPYMNSTAEKDILRLLSHFPAVAIVEPRQVGKTSLAQHIAAQWTLPTLYLDLENPRDLNKLSDPFLFLNPFKSKRSYSMKYNKYPICSQY